MRDWIGFCFVRCSTRGGVVSRSVHQTAHVTPLSPRTPGGFPLNRDNPPGRLGPRLPWPRNVTEGAGGFQGIKECGVLMWHSIGGARLVTCGPPYFGPDSQGGKQSKADARQGRAATRTESTHVTVVGSKVHK